MVPIREWSVAFVDLLSDCLFDLFHDTTNVCLGAQPVFDPWLFPSGHINNIRSQVILWFAHTFENVSLT